jgi:hypothetical protein
MSASGTPTLRVGRSERYLRSWGPPTAVTLMAAGALIFDVLTPQVVSVTTLYTGLVLIGYWLPQPRAGGVANVVGISGRSLRYGEVT